MGEFEQKQIKTLSVYLTLAAGVISTDEAAKALSVDKIDLKIGRKNILQDATKVVKSLLKGK